MFCTPTRIFLPTSLFSTSFGSFETQMLYVNRAIVDHQARMKGYDDELLDELVKASESTDLIADEPEPHFSDDDSNNNMHLNTHTVTTNPYTYHSYHSTVCAPRHITPKALILNEDGTPSMSGDEPKTENAREKYLEEKCTKLEKTINSLRCNERELQESNDLLQSLVDGLHDRLGELSMAEEKLDLMAFRFNILRKQMQRMKQAHVLCRDTSSYRTEYSAHSSITN